jgi:hypothetical protein
VFGAVPVRLKLVVRVTDHTSATRSSRFHGELSRSYGR